MSWTFLGLTARPPARTKRPAPGDRSLGAGLVAAFLLGLTSYVFVWGVLGQPAVHFFFDNVALRDGGTFLASRPLSFVGLVDFAYATLGHQYGPLQYVVTNIFYLAAGDVLPLVPAMTQLPNTILIGATAALAFALGKLLYSSKTGYAFAAVFVLLPWLPVPTREGLFFQSLTCLTQVAVIYAYSRHFLCPQDRLYIVLAPVSLAFYLSTGLDWPSFLFFLLVYAWLDKKFVACLANPFNLIPVAVIAVYAWWTYQLYRAGNPAYRSTILLYSFFKASPFGGMADPSLVFWFIRAAFGISFFTAFAGVVVSARKFMAEVRTNDAPRREQLGRRLAAAAALWFLLALVPLLATSQYVNYAVVVAVPMALLSAVFLDRFSRAAIVGILAIMVAWQCYYILKNPGFVWQDDDRRVLAAATYLIEQRPDLLGEDKTAFLPREIPANVGQYARGRQGRIVMQVGYPESRRITGVASPKAVLDDFVMSYETTGTIRADWLILVPELLVGPAAAFYESLLGNPNVFWLVRMRDEVGREIWLGTVERRGRPLDEAIVQAVGPLADRYIERYDRISFLKRNVEFIWRY